MSTQLPQTQLAVLLFESFDAMDAAGPYEVLRWLPNARVSFVAKARGPVRSENGGLAFVADYTLADLPAPDVIIVPGGDGELRMREDPEVCEWLRSAAARGAWIASVCTGALLLGAAGLLRGRRATTHWLAWDELSRFGATPVRERYVFDGKLVTSAGVSAGVDMALALAAKLRSNEIAQAIQLGIEYDPAPPFQSGSPARAPAEVVAQVRGLSRFNRPAA